MPSARSLVRTLLAALALPVLMVAALRSRRRERRTRPAIFWGIAPLISFKYQSQAMRRLGYESATVVYGLYVINDRSDFDYVTEELVDAAPLVGRLPLRLRRALEPYWTFLWALRRYDVFVTYADSTVLHWTPLRHLDLQLLRLAGKKIVLLAYGADVLVVSRFRNLLFKHAYGADYPAYARAEKQTLGDLEYCSRFASYIVSGIDWVESMPYWDGLRSNHFAIDTAEWAPRVPATADRAEQRPVVVLHAPNHREIKGTRFLVQACEELVAEGVPLELRIVERVPNIRLRELIEEADIVADQFVIGWYAFFSIEAMSLGKPVLCYLRPELVELYGLFGGLGDLPIVDTPPLEIKEVLRELAGDAERRAELGRRGSAFVEAHHSLEAIGEWFDDIFRQVWQTPAA